jgi:cell division protein FtsL
MTAIEHQELKGITVKNLIVTIASTASIVISVMTTYFQLKNDIHDVRNQQETQARINEIRLKVLEGNVAMLRQQVDEIITKTHPNQNTK